jgi:small neutral amino acid transporter SnatA (MarC family)
MVNIVFACLTYFLLSLSEQFDVVHVTDILESSFYSARALSGSVIFNHVIIDAFRVAGFLLVMIGIFQVLSGKTIQRNELDNRTNV